MTPFTSDQYVMLALVFVLGLLIGMFLLAGGKWKRRYREENARRIALERDNEALRQGSRDDAALRGAAVKAPARRPADPDRPL